MSETADMHGPIDAVNCGPFQCSLYMHNSGIQFQVTGVGMFDISDLEVGSSRMFATAGQTASLRLRRLGPMHFVIKT